MQPTPLGLGNIPLEDIRFRNPDILGKLHGAVAAASKLDRVSRRIICRTRAIRLTAPITSTLGDRPEFFLPASNDSFTDSIRRSWLAYGTSLERASPLGCVNCQAQSFTANAEPVLSLSPES